MSRQHEPSPGKPGVLTAELLKQALSYVQYFRGRKLVIKLGGAAMSEAELAKSFAYDIVALSEIGVLPVVVHGGGKHIDEVMTELGRSPKFVDGRRVTDAETLEIVRMVLVGKVNTGIVADINRHGPLAVGISGEDAGLIGAVPRDPSLGFVGEVASVNPGIVERLLAMRLIPVVSSIGSDLDGQSYNINADSVAGALAAALRADRLMMLSNVPGLLEDVNDSASLRSEVSADEVRSEITAGVVTGGMLPKLEACLQALDRGVGAAHLLDGTLPHILLLEMFTDEGVGTMIHRGSWD